VSGNHPIMAKSVPLTFLELFQIDPLFTKAGTVLAEARSRLEALDYDLAVRRAQESLELFVKNLFRFLQRAYPTTHDLKKELYSLIEAIEAFEGHSIERRQIARLVLAGSVLNLWRSPAFYGDETLNVGNLFDKREAELAISYAELGQLVTSIVRDRVYAAAADAQKT
jgi:HEPN domain-containing protein